MRSQTPPAFDVTVHIVLNDFGPLGRAYCETDEVEADEETVVENILNGQYSHPLRVIAFNTAEGWARDVTEDIARAVLDRARGENRSIGKATQEFLERTLRLDAIVGLEKWMAEGQEFKAPAATRASDGTF
jgi:hypothetical protein